MVHVKEAETSKLLDKVMEELKQKDEIKKPDWANHVKTGQDKERRPQEDDWWFKRAASILRRLYLKPGTGVSSLRTWYGGAQRRGSRPQKHKKASGKIIRTILQQLEEAEYAEKAEKGRKLTSEGRSLLETATNQVKSE